MVRDSCGPSAQDIPSNWGIYGWPQRGALGRVPYRKQLSVNFIVILILCPDVVAKLLLWLDSKITIVIFAIT